MQNNSEIVTSGEATVVVNGRVSERMYNSKVTDLIPKSGVLVIFNGEPLEKSLLNKNVYTIYGK